MLIFSVFLGNSDNRKGGARMEKCTGARLESKAVYRKGEVLLKIHVLGDAFEKPPQVLPEIAAALGAGASLEDIAAAFPEDSHEIDEIARFIEGCDPTVSEIAYDSRCGHVIFCRVPEPLPPIGHA